MSRSSAHAALGYRLLLRLLGPLLLLHTARLGHRQKERGYLRQRLGLYRQAAATAPLWIHAASVGEFSAALPLIESLRHSHPALPLLVTTATPSGGQQARTRLPAGVDHAYLPIDWPGAVRRFLRHFQPRGGVIIETEIWPELFAACDDHATPLCIANGRLSQRTLNSPAWLRRQYAEALKRVQAVLARSDEDARRFIALGAAEAKVETVGNIKFAATAAEPPQAIDLGRPYVLAASTRDGEEMRVVEAWRRAQAGTQLLVLAPRHPQRLGAILRDLEPFGLQLAIRSRGEPIKPSTDVYIADTFGELRGFMAGAELIYMGGSLVDKGGHNLLEPAALGKAVITGPHMDNFLDETRLLLEGGGLVQVDSVEALASTFDQLLSDEQRCLRLGQCAKAVMTRESDMAERYRRALERLFRLEAP